MLKDISAKQEISKVRSDLKTACDAIREELDMHLDTINQSTDEIQQNYEYLAQIEGKIDKITERLDAIELAINRSAGRLPSTSINLTHREQEVFIVIYSSPDRVNKHTIKRRLGFTEEMVEAYISNMVAKGVPVLKQVLDNEPHYFLDHEFRQLQAKKKIVKIEETIVREIFQTSG